MSEAIHLRISRDYRSILIVGLLCATSIQCHDATSQIPEPSSKPSKSAAFLKGDDELLLLASRDPIEFLRYCRTYYEATIVDYRGRFSKQERIKGRIRDEQVTEIRFREKPYSVDMRWVRNPGKASRVTYVAGRHVENDREMACIEPSGIVGLLVTSVKRDIHSPEAREESRRTIDQFGFKNSLDLIIKYCEKATGESGYSLTFKGMEAFQGRPCYVFERRLPYDGEQGIYPDRLLVIQIDSEWLVPVGVFAYSDSEGRELLGRYVFTEIEYNTGLSDADF